MPKGQAKGILFAVRLPSNDANKIERAIEKSGKKKPDWARTALLNAAES